MARKPAERKPCVVCGGPIPLTLRANARMCSPECQVARKRQKEQQPGLKEKRLAYEESRKARRRATIPVRNCEVCGSPILSGIKSGQQPKTCSPECHAERKRRIERERYDDPQDREHRKETQRQWYARLSPQHRVEVGRKQREARALRQLMSISTALKKRSEKK